MPHPNRSPQLIAEGEIGATLCTFGHVMLRGILCGFIFLLMLILAPLRVVAAPPHRAMFLQDIPFLVEASRFGGFSALHIAPGGVKFILISDRGAFVTGRFLRDAPGSIESICSIPEHCIDARRLPLFIARSALRDLIAGLHADAKGVQAA